MTEPTKCSIHDLDWNEVSIRPDGHTGSRASLPYAPVAETEGQWGDLL